MSGESENTYDVVIAGQGASAFSAALYAARYQMKAVVIGETFGGETALGGMIENYPGYPEVDGFELMMKFREQARKSMTCRSSTTRSHRSSATTTASSQRQMPVTPIYRRL